MTRGTYMPNITTNHAITYTNNKSFIFQYSYTLTLLEILFTLQSDIYITLGNS